MTQDEFNKLPPLLTRAAVVECGISKDVIDTIAVTLASAATEVPYGRIGAVPIGGGRKRLYRRSDVANVIGW